MAPVTPVGQDDVACRVCGCTEDTPCAGGCAWVEDPGDWMGDLCSACLPGVLAELGPW